MGEKEQIVGRTYSVIGSGALGGFYGCRLQRAGLDVQFLARSDYPVLKERGWRVRSKDGDFDLPHVRAFRSIEEIPPADVALLCLKSTSNAGVLSKLARVIRPDGVVIVMENGFGIEEEVARHVGPERVMGACCFLCSNKTRPGEIDHLDYGTIAMGELPRGNKGVGITPRMESIAQDFLRAGIETQLAEDLRLARWKKLVWNIPFNGLSVVLLEETNRLVSDPALRPLVRGIMEEVVGAARADGREIPSEFIETMLSHTEVMKPYKTSMRIDFDERRPLEVEAIFGSPLAVANERQVPMPMVWSLYQQLQFLDRRNREPRV
jgi:2-dehydropantoate 2-reductase